VLALPWRLDNKTHRQAATLWLLLLWTGCRSNEVCEARATDIDGDWLRVVQGKNANARRRIPIAPVIRPLVADLKAVGDEFLIPGLVSGGRRGGVNEKRNKLVGKYLRDFIQRGGVDKTAHELRNTFAQRMAEHAVMPTLKSLLGHSGGGDITAQYIGQLQPEALRRAMAALTYGEDIDSACRVMALRLGMAWKHAGG